MTFIQTNLKNLFNLGITPTLSLSEKRSIRFTNFSLIYGLAFCLASFPLNWFFIGLVEGLVPLFFFFLFCLGFYFQKKHQFQRAKFFILGTALFGVMLSTWLFGLKGNPYYMFLLTFPAGLVLFPRKQHQLKLLLVHIVCLALTLLGSLYIPPIMEITLPFTFGLMTFLFSIILLFFIISNFTDENQNFEEKTNALVASLQTKNKEIDKQKNDLQSFNHRLQQEIDAKNIAQSQLKESNKQLKRFVYVASHDLKEPLRTIGSFSQLLQMQSAKQLDEESLQYLHFITGGVKRMSNLLEDLLAYSRIENQNNLSKTLIDLEEVIKTQKANLTDLIQRKKGVIEIITPLPNIYGFSSQINQLFQNLISNALKFSGERPPIVQISCEEEEQHFVFAIKDNGIGIPEKYQHKIFEAFQRLHETEFEGTGIGLTICRKVLKNHGGKIWFTSKEGIGTRFYFSIAKAPIDSDLIPDEALVSV